MKKIILILLIVSTNTIAAVVETQNNKIDALMTMGDTESSLLIDGDTLIKMTTGLAECPLGVYIKNTPNSAAIFSTALSAYISKQSVKFQVWNNANRFWVGSSTPYCQVRAIVLAP